MTRRTGCGVTAWIRSPNLRPSAGEPSASNSTTPSRVTTKPALELKPWLAVDTMPA